MKRNLGDPSAPLFREVRELILRKCAPDKKKKFARFLRSNPSARLERFVTQKLLDVIKSVAKEELNSESWLHVVAGLTGRGYKQLRVTLLEFMDTDVFSLSPENCVSFLEPLIESGTSTQ